MTPERWRQIEELYQAALERDETLRGAFLHEACAGDEDLQREVESLLAQGQTTGSFLEKPAMEVAAQALVLEPSQTLIGRQLGSYYVLSQIGAGGMGEVYLAKDTKLRREVALKVLPPALASESERLARFRREAQLLASLNHTNIAAIYGFEESPEANFLILELVPGETLAERLARTGPVPVAEALPLAQQIAEALEFAHQKGITHRDIKPANIKITPEGQVKVLDFGLAKVFEAPEAGVDLSQSPTRTGLRTEEGRILGTPAYMSPEQARGQPVDKRTDIWAFGCLLYELLTGQPIFRGETISDTLARILEREPDWQSLPEETPANVRSLLRRCLQKDADRRLHDIADARIEIEEAQGVPATTQPTSAPVTKPAKGWWWVLAAGVVVAVAASIVVWNLKPTPQPPVSRTVIALPPGQRLAALDQPAIAISPDGKNLVYVAVQTNPSPERERGVASSSEPPLAGARGSDPSTQQLFLRPLDSNESKPIAGTEGAVAPFFSPDGQWIGFFAGGELKKVSVNGGVPVSLASAPDPGGASWSSQGTLAFQPLILFGQGLRQVSQEGGTPQLLTRGWARGGPSSLAGVPARRQDGVICEQARHGRVEQSADCRAAGWTGRTKNFGGRNPAPICSDRAFALRAIWNSNGGTV